MSTLEVFRLVEHLDVNTVGMGLLVLGMAFTARQRSAIKERDQHKCQATARHNCNQNEHPLEVDHIIPQGYAHRMGICDEYIDSPENALTKCRAAHDVKHPERVPIRRDYHRRKAEPGYNMSQELQNYARERLDHKQIYWNDKDDRTDKIRALQLTQKAQKRGWRFPSREDKKKT